MQRIADDVGARPDQSTFAEFARTALELEDCHLALPLDNGFLAVGTNRLPLVAAL